MVYLEDRRRHKKDKKKVSKGGVLPSGSLTFIFTLVLLVTFLLGMFSNMASSAPASNSINAGGYLSGSGSINETTNPAGLTNLHSDFPAFQWIIVGILVVLGAIILATLIPSWL